MNKIAIPKITFWRVVLAAILLSGLYSTTVRFAVGLGASTALTDRFPWGLWIGFDVLCGVALAAGGFTVSAVVYVFHIKRFQPIIRPAILTAFLGYLLVITALMFDLGRPYRIWHALIMWNPHSVMFEVAWCVMLYTTVLALEFSPILFERLKWQKPLKIVHALTIPLVILGVLLSMLHQSSLGSLYLIVPTKLHPLWYSPFLPVFFFISALALGCAMTILESYLSFRAFGKHLELSLLSDLGKVIAVTLVLYLVLKFQDLNGRGVLHLAFQPTYAGRMFLAEMLLGVVAPIVLLLIPWVRKDVFGLFFAALMPVLGTIMNRLNVSITGLEASTGLRYVPSWTEASVTVMIVAVGFVLFGLAVKYLPVFPESKEAAEGGVSPDTQLLLVFRRPLPRGRKISLAVGSLAFFLVILLAYDGLRFRSSESMVSKSVVSAAKIAPVVEVDFQGSSEIQITGHPESPGPVTFRHESHLDMAQPDCTACHSKLFTIVKASRNETSRKEMHSQENCGACHNGKQAFDIQEDCTLCHE